MVHGLETLKKLNGKGRCRNPCSEDREKVPRKYEFNPYLARRYVNRSWSKKDGLKEKVRT